jgi:hypothetical protein
MRLTTRPGLWITDAHDPSTPDAAGLAGTLCFWASWRPFPAKATTEQVDFTSFYEIATHGTDSGWLCCRLAPAAPESCSSL